jgi:hypothetical protein
MVWVGYGPTPPQLATEWIWHEGRKAGSEGSMHRGCCVYLSWLTGGYRGQ